MTETTTNTATISRAPLVAPPGRRSAPWIYSWTGSDGQGVEHSHTHLASLTGLLRRMGYQIRRDF